MTINRKKVDLALARNGWTVSDLAKSYGASRNWLYAILNGSNILPKTANKLAKTLGVDVTEILEDEA